MASDETINVLAIQKQGHTHLFLYRDGLEGDMLRALGRAAADSETNFSWYDAAVLGQKVRANQVNSSKSSKTSRW
jgi:hypothetical protein